jgi:hypothetical protein
LIDGSPNQDPDARIALTVALAEIWRAEGKQRHACATQAVALLAKENGRRRSDLEDAVASELDTSTPGGFLDVAIAVDDLVRLSVVELRGSRIFLQPALAELLSTPRLSR